MFLWLALVTLLVSVACDSNATLIVESEATVEPIATPDQPAAFLADEQNTVDVVNALGPGVVAINVTVQAGFSIS